MMKESLPVHVSHSGIYLLGGSTSIFRLGFGAMRITGPGIWGWPADRNQAVRLIQHAVYELGINFIDTADSYGPEVSELLIAEALSPYPDELVIATKGGLTRPRREDWEENCHPEYLTQCVENSLRRLKKEQIDLYQLHAVDPAVPIEDSVGALKKMQDQGKIRYLGLSNVTVEEIKRAEKVAKFVSIQNHYNIRERGGEKVLDYCEQHDMAFIPWYPLGSGNLVRPGGVFENMAVEKGVTPSQLALAWLLKHSPAMIPIPGTSSIQHLNENAAAASLDLTQDEMDLLGSL